MKSINPLARLLLRASQRARDGSRICRRCMHKQATFQQTQYPTSQSPFLKAFRQNGARQVRHESGTASIRPGTFELGTIARNTASQQARTSKSTFPETNHKNVAYWLLGSAASVFGIVIFGGLTRLTESGLSITEWRPVTGSLPPTTTERWNEEFQLYRASPEFKMLNPRMTLDEFKQIYWMEWTHRLWGRIVGITFLIPTAYFIIRRRVTPRMAWRLVGISGLIGFQGVIGWWMVKSGLKDDLFSPGSYPRVSQYRLTAHLGTAFICYLAMLWNGLSILREHKLLADPAEAQKFLQKIGQPGLKVFRRSAAALTALIFITAMSGGLVAGLDAGLIYNEFPYMGLGLTPPKKELWDPFYSHVEDRSDLWWRNMLENPSLVQLDHRIMATTTFTAVMALWAYSRFNPRIRASLPTTVRKGVRGVVHLVWLQVTLGITTLLYLVPVPIAAAHQAGALALLSGALVLGNRIWISKRTAQLVAKHLGRSPSHAASCVGRRGPDAMLAARTGIYNKV